MAAISSLILGGLILGKTALDVAGQRKAAKAARKEGEYNAQVSEDQATDALARGEEAAGHVASQAKVLTGAQRTSLAASGVDINSGSARDVISNDQRLAALDIEHIRQNAAREAHGLEVQAEGYRAAGRNQSAAYTNQMYSTLIGGAADLFSVYQSFGRSRVPRRAATSTGSGGFEGEYRPDTGGF